MIDIYAQELVYRFFQAKGVKQLLMGELDNVQSIEMVLNNVWNQFITDEHLLRESRCSFNVESF